MDKDTKNRSANCMFGDIYSEGKQGKTSRLKYSLQHKNVFFTLQKRKRFYHYSIFINREIMNTLIMP